MRHETRAGTILLQRPGTAAVVAAPSDAASFVVQHAPVLMPVGLVIASSMSPAQSANAAAANTR